MDIVRTERTAHDLAAEQAQWQTWIDAVCADLGVPSSLVDVEAIHDLSRQVAHGLARPLAPVSTFILGMAVGRGMDRARRRLPCQGRPTGPLRPMGQGRPMGERPPSTGQHSRIGSPHTSDPRNTERPTCLSQTTGGCAETGATRHTPRPDHRRVWGYRGNQGPLANKTSAGVRILGAAWS